MTAELAAVESALKANAFSKSLKRGVMASPDLALTVEALILKRALQALSLANKAGLASSGFDKVEGLVGKIKELTSVPVCVGFGISTPEHAEAVAKAGADGVIIGSKIVGLIESTLGDRERIVAEVSAFLAQVKSAI